MIEINSYNLVFQSSVNYRLLDMSIYILIFILAFLLINKLKNKTNITEKEILFFKYLRYLLYIFIVTVVLGYLIEVVKIISVNNSLKNKDYITINGKINNFHPMPKSGHDIECFYVDKEYFVIHYTGNYPKDDSLFYSYTKNRNGPIIKNGQEVVIQYIKFFGENKIIKLWVKN